MPKLQQGIAYADMEGARARNHIRRDGGRVAFAAGAGAQPKTRGLIMLSWAVTFLVIGLIAGVLGITGVAGTATHIAYVLFVVFLILAVVGMVMGRRPPAV